MLIFKAYAANVRYVFLCWLVISLMMHVLGDS